MRTGSGYVNYLSYFQQWNLDQELTFYNPTIDSKLGLRLYCKFFPIYKEILRFLNVALSGVLIFSQVMKKI